MTALVAYLAHLALATLLAARKDVPPTARYLFAAGLLVYYAMQFFFLDLLLRAVTTGKRAAVRVLLGACVVPMGVCAWAAGRYAWSCPETTGGGKVVGVSAVAALAALPLATCSSTTSPSVPLWVGRQRLSPLWPSSRRRCCPCC